MSTYLTGDAIRALREKKGFTQRELATSLGVTDKAVSKWETGRGLPDISLVEPLAHTLGVSVAELLSGTCAVNTNRSANMLRTVFYVCPVCGNVIHASGEGSFSCCGITLPVQEAESIVDADEIHQATIELVDGDLYVRLPHHPMTKQHYISFIAYVTSDIIQLRKLYPEQEPEARFPRNGVGSVYVFCNQHGLFKGKMSPKR